ncbi:hypothetical protein RR48_09671 [Papilio machaon]|uniref:Uncharacterized protein n=1 Tax=Papilio machaon TaxID=76193 RepID=A0A194RD37_PAPMA|nr:hypothetical protein RR48_09671 [Papilio machaon]
MAVSATAQFPIAAALSAVPPSVGFPWFRPQQFS